MPPNTGRPTSHFYKTYLKGEFFYGFWNMVSRGVGFLNTLITLTQLTVYQYGVFQLILASFSGLSIFIGLGGETIRNDILRYIGENKVSFAKKLFYESFFLRLTIGIGLWASVFFGAPYFFSNYGPDFIYYIQIISFLFLHDSILPSIQQVLEADKKFNLIASRASLSKIVQLGILGYYFVFQDAGLREVLLSLVIASFVSLLFMLVIVFKRYYVIWKKIESTQDALIRRLLLSYGKWELLRPAAAKLTNFVQVWITKFFIGTEAVALFSVAQTMIGMIANLLPINTLSALVPREVADRDRMQKIYNTGTKYLVLLSILMGLVALVLTPPFIRFFFPKYIAVLPLFSVMLVTLPIIALSALAGIFLVVYRKQGFLLFHKILKGIISSLLIALLVPMLGLWGLPVQTIILSTILYVILYVYMWRADIAISIQLREIFRFDNTDRELFRNVISDGRKYLARWLPKRN